VSELASLDSVLDEHLRSATVSNNTSKTIQNDLLDCMYEVYEQTLMEEIQNANFVSIQADETTDISCMCQFVILLRYVKCDGRLKDFIPLFKFKIARQKVWRQFQNKN
jgi:hypothetical protein